MRVQRLADVHIQRLRLEEEIAARNRTLEEETAAKNRAFEEETAAINRAIDEKMTDAGHQDVLDGIDVSKLDSCSSQTDLPNSDMIESCSSKEAASNNQVPVETFDVEMKEPTDVRVAEAVACTLGGVDEMIADSTNQIGGDSVIKPDISFQSAVGSSSLVELGARGANYHIENAVVATEGISDQLEAQSSVDSGGNLVSDASIQVTASAVNAMDNTEEAVGTTQLISE